MLGTSDPGPDVPNLTDYDYYVFAKTVDGPPVELTSAEPRASFLVTFQAQALGPDETLTTGGAIAESIGSISASGMPDGTATPLVFVRIRDPRASEGASEQVVTMFELSHQLSFEGSCKDPTVSPPCTAQVVLEFARTDGGERGGSLHVPWRLDLSAAAQREGTGERFPAETLPWNVEIVEQTELPQP